MEEPLHLVAPEEPGRQPVVGPATFEALFQSHRDELYGAMALVTHDRGEAEELTQEAFVKVLERWDRVGAMDDPTGYLYRTAMNLFRKRYRRAALAARRSVGLAPSRDPIEDVDARDAAARALAPLTPKQRAAIVLTDLLGFPSEEAARMLGVRASTVRMHASIARATLRKTMGGGGR